MEMTISALIRNFTLPPRFSARFFAQIAIHLVGQRALLRSAIPSTLTTKGAQPMDTASRFHFSFCQLDLEADLRLTSTKLKPARPSLISATPVAAKPCDFHVSTNSENLSAPFNRRAPMRQSILLCSLLALAGCNQAAPAAADETPDNAAAPSKLGSDWPIFLGPNHDSRSPETGILTEWGKTGPRLIWHKELGTSYGAPTIAEGRLMQFDRFGDRSRLYCLDAKTGQEVWRHEVPTEYEDLYNYNNGPRTSPLIDDERVYAYGVDGVLFCCQTADGKELWRKYLNEQFGVVQNFFGVGSTPVIEGDLLIVMVGGSPPESQRVAPGQLDRVESNGTAIVAFDKRTGDVKYKIGDDLASYASLKLATIDGRRWCFAFCRGGLLAFEPATGKIDFRYPWRDEQLESVNASMPVVAGNEVLISECYGVGSSLLRVQPGKFEIVWKDDRRKRDKALMTHWMTPIYDSGYLYGCSGRHPHEATLRCLEWKTGKVQWEQPGMARTSLLAIDGHMLCLGEYGQLWLLKCSPEKVEHIAALDYSDPDLGNELLGKSAPVLQYPCWAAPIVSHGLLYLRGKDRLICLELIKR
jgi:outer membrane protein assembly factor BamB